MDEPLEAVYDQLYTQYARVLEQLSDISEDLRLANVAFERGYPETARPIVLSVQEKIGTLLDSVPGVEEDHDGGV